MNFLLARSRLRPPLPLRLACIAIIAGTLALGFPWLATGADGPSSLPPLVGTSRFLSDVDVERETPAPPPTEAPLLRWDFSRARAWAYDYAQKGVAENHVVIPAMGPNATRDQPEQSVSADGLLLVQATGSGSAQMVLDLKMRMERAGQAPVRSSPGALKVEGLQEDGSIRGAGAPENPTMRLLFPLPSRPLKVGEAETNPRSFPIPIMSSSVQARGVSRLVLTRYVTMRGHLCARLDSSLDVTKIDVPPDLKGTFRFLTRARSVYYFDLEDRGFVGGRVAVVTSTRAVGAPPDFGISREPAFRVFSDSDTLIMLQQNPSRTRAANTAPRR